MWFGSFLNPDFWSMHLAYHKLIKCFMQVFKTQQMYFESFFKLRTLGTLSNYSFHTCFQSTLSIFWVLFPTHFYHVCIWCTFSTSGKKAFRAYLFSTFSVFWVILLTHSFQVYIWHTHFRQIQFFRQFSQRVLCVFWIFFLTHFFQVCIWCTYST